MVCSRRHADELFLPLLDVLGEVRDQVSITADDYIVIQVDGEGVDAGRRVVELTSPLALAGMSVTWPFPLASSCAPGGTLTS